MPNSLISVYFRMLSTKKFGFIALITIMAIIGSIPSIDSYLIKTIIDYAEKYTGDQEADFLSQMLFWACIYGLWWEFINWMWRLYDFIYMRTMPGTKSYIINNYFSYVQSHSHKFFQQNLAGFITNRIVEAARSFEMIFAAFNERVFRKVFTLAAAIITLYNVNSVFATIFTIWLSVFLGMSAIFIRKVKTLSTNWARNRSLISGKIVDSISNISSVRMYNNHEFEEQRLGTYLENMVVSEKILNWFMLRLRYFQGLSCSTMIFGMMYYLGMLRASNHITIGDFALVITLCITVADDVWDFTQEIGDMFEEIGAFSQSLDLLEQHEIQDNPGSKLLEIKKGKIEFKNVTFRYKTDRNIFKEKSILIEPRQKVGLVGYSGSGKTTFINLITRMFDIESGQILIDDQNIKEVSQSSLRDKICVIPQEPILFNRSILENIKYGKQSASEEEIISAAKKAHIHDDILKLSEGYLSRGGEKGSALSGGQRQRIAIARAILKDSPILILDEATSALDSITEKHIQDSLEYLMQNKTVLVIAHRLSTLKNMDRIIVFDRGRIVEDGTHSKLYKEGKLYTKLWESQISGFISDHPAL